MLSARLKVMLADLGLSPEDAARVLHVSPRTVRYWIAGKTAIPYSAYRLLRIMRLWELPMPGWDGWVMHSGKLWSPEGHAFEPQDSAWWSLLVRQARCFRTLYQESWMFKQALRASMAGLDQAGEAPGAGQAGALAPAGQRSASHPDGASRPGAEGGRPNLLLDHFIEQRYLARVSKGVTPPTGQYPLTTMEESAS